MKIYRISQFGLHNLKRENAPLPHAGFGEMLIEIKALSLNYRDLLIIEGTYNPRLKLPLIPISDGAGVVTGLGTGVTGFAVGDHVVIHASPGWINGPFQFEAHKKALGSARDGLAAETVALPAETVLPMPDGYTFAEAATLPTAGLTAWNALVTDGQIRSGQTVLTLGTGGVSIFALQLAKALGAKVLVTSSSDAKLERARRLGADHTINYRTHPDWGRLVMEITSGRGADITVETGGAGTLEQSMRATCAGGMIALLGSLSGLKHELDIRLIEMKRLRVFGIYIGSREHFVTMNSFLEKHHIDPEIDRTFRFDDLPAALQYSRSEKRFGKIVVGT